MLIQQALQGYNDIKAMTSSPEASDGSRAGHELQGWLRSLFPFHQPPQPEKGKFDCPNFKIPQIDGKVMENLNEHFMTVGERVSAEFSHHFSCWHLLASKKKLAEHMHR